MNGFPEMIEIYDLSERDADLNHEIEHMKAKIRQSKVNLPHLQAEGEQLLHEILEAVGNGIKGDVDNDGEIHQGGDTKNLHRRQMVDIVSALLAAQEAVFEKHCVPHTAPCMQGPEGDNGTTGDTGPSGSPGTDGQPGSRGSAGDTGPPGLKGEQGPHGVQGNNGTSGIDGLPGDTGSWGDAGEKGVGGLTGLKGDAGVKGRKGDIGVTGPSGVNGTSGIKGLRGEPGDVGLPGVNGTRGPSDLSGSDVNKISDGCQCYTKPEFDAPVDDTYSVGIGNRFVLPCGAHGNPPPSVSVHNLPQKSGRKRALTQIGSSYILDNVTDTDYGSYVCKATNVYGTASKTTVVQRP